MMMRMVVVTTQTMAYTKALVADNKEEEEDGEGTRVLFCLAFSFLIFTSFLFFVII